MKKFALALFVFLAQTILIIIKLIISLFIIAVATVLAISVLKS